MGGRLLYMLLFLYLWPVILAFDLLSIFEQWAAPLVGLISGLLQGGVSGALEISHIALGRGGTRRLLYGTGRAQIDRVVSVPEPRTPPSLDMLLDRAGGREAPPNNMPNAQRLAEALAASLEARPPTVEREAPLRVATILEEDVEEGQEELLSSPVLGSPAIPVPFLSPIKERSLSPTPADVDSAPLEAAIPGMPFFPPSTADVAIPPSLELPPTNAPLETGPLPLGGAQQAQQLPIMGDFEQAGGEAPEAAAVLRLALAPEAAAEALEHEVAAAEAWEQDERPALMKYVMLHRESLSVEEPTPGAQTAGGPSAGAGVGLGVRAGTTAAEEGPMMASGALLAAAEAVKVGVEGVGAAAGAGQAEGLTEEWANPFCGMQVCFLDEREGEVEGEGGATMAAGGKAGAKSLGPAPSIRREIESVLFDVDDLQALVATGQLPTPCSPVANASPGAFHTPGRPQEARQRSRRSRIQGARDRAMSDGRGDRAFGAQEIRDEAAAAAAATGEWVLG